MKNYEPLKKDNKDLPNPYIEMYDKEKKFGKIKKKINY